MYFYPMNEILIIIGSIIRIISVIIILSLDH